MIPDHRAAFKKRRDPSSGLGESPPQVGFPCRRSTIGNLPTIVDAGRPIGWVAATGQTNLYTVIIQPVEGVWTAHPGLPRVGS